MAYSKPGMVNLAVVILLVSPQSSGTRAGMRMVRWKREQIQVVEDEATVGVLYGRRKTESQRPRE